VEFHALSDEEKAAILSDHLQDKEEKGNTPKNVSNTALGKILDFRIRDITSIVSYVQFVVPIQF